MGKQVALEQWFHEHRAVLESTSGDLHAAGVERKWNALAEIIDVELLQKLDGKGTKTVAGYKAERFRGKVGEISWEVWWIPELRLPGKIVQTKGKTRTETSLKVAEQGSLPQSANDFRRIDYADLGDLESDPLVQAILRDSHGHGHHH